MSKVKVGIAGCGDIANRAYLPNLTQSEWVEVVAVCDVVEARAIAARDRFGVAKAYGRYEELLADDDLSLVVILSPIPWHGAMVRQALEMGKHVYVEKPLALSYDEAQALRDLAAAKNLLLASAPSTLLDPNHQIVKELIDKEAIGTICFTRARSSHGGAAWSSYWTTDPSWFYKKGGGPLYDMGVYQIHLLTYLFGPVRRVNAMSRIAVPERRIRSGPAAGKTVTVEVDDCTLMTLEFANGSFAFVDATFCVRGYKGPWVEIFGAFGTININRAGEGEPIEVYQDDHETNLKGWRAPWRPPAKPYTLATGVDHIAEAMLSGKQPLLSAEHAVHVVEVMEKAYVAAREGRTVPVASTFDHTRRLADWRNDGIEPRRGKNA